jgi:hypothetical protein
MADITPLARARDASLRGGGVGRCTAPVLAMVGCGACDGVPRPRRRRGEKIVD